MLKDEMEESEERPYQFSESELVVRHMALEDRFQRRVRSRALNEIIRQFRKGMERLCGAILPSPTDGNKTGYVLLMVSKPEGDMTDSGFGRRHIQGLLDIIVSDDDDPHLCVIQEEKGKPTSTSST